MATIQPFRALRPRPDLASQVASVPYDVVNRQEAAALAAGNAASFLHVTKPEIDMPADADPYSDDVYQQGATALRRLRDEGTLIRDAQPCLYIYALTWRGHTQIGIVLLASVSEYDANIVRKHEHTRPDKEDDRVRHMEILGAQSGTVFLTHRDHHAIATVVQAVTAAPPLVAFTADDEVTHRFWVVDDATQIQALIAGFAANGPLYIADGHHRSAAASRVAAARGLADAGFLAVSFPVSEMRILPYNRIVRDLGRHDAAGFLAAVGERFDVTPGKPTPSGAKQFGMFLAGAWHTLRARPGSWDPTDPVARLDVSILQEQLLAPLLGIADPRRDKRIEFVGGIRGDAELERRTGDGVAFALHATAIADLLAIADAEEVMPPKSTWFEPKLRDGLFVHLLE